ncbi:HNH endonuclease [Delftia acidovorans]|uniref:HNH endonuclease n=1 Tax=Delftia acidovorans TaxID=80866 RepID=UPI000F839B93|nr:HNH endonuclease domain-containing protein [Delftia acidovorans]
MKQEVEDFKFSAAEEIIINAALKTAKPWNYKDAKSIRTRIIQFHYNLTRKLCCYCQDNLHGAFMLVVDPEHILPSSLFKDLSYTIWNLSASCKRCNMNIKRARVDFINHAISDRKCSQHYFLIHPNFDIYDNHLRRILIQNGENRLIKYKICDDAKGRYTYNYFRLHELEIENFDKYQGISNAPLDSEIANDVKELAKKFGIL